MAVVKKETAMLKNFVNGEWVSSTSNNSLEVPNPATEENMAYVPLSSKEDVSLAVSAAEKAFQTWSKVPVPKRARILFAYHALLVKHHDDLAELVVKENGKSYKEAYGEVLRGIECVEFATGAPT